MCICTPGLYSYATGGLAGEPISGSGAIAVSEGASGMKVHLTGQLDSYTVSVWT